MQCTLLKNFRFVCEKVPGQWHRDLFSCWWDRHHSRSDSKSIQNLPLTAPFLNCFIFIRKSGINLYFTVFFLQVQGTSTYREERNFWIQFWHSFDWWNFLFLLEIAPIWFSGLRWVIAVIGVWKILDLRGNKDSRTTVYLKQNPWYKLICSEIFSYCSILSNH